jgi:hypothetical protein
MEDFPTAVAKTLHSQIAQSIQAAHFRHTEYMDQALLVNPLPEEQGTSNSRGSL